MPPLRFRGNPYRVLEVRSDASNATIKRRWRELAREHHPDRAAGDGEEAARLTAQMAQINAAYDLLRDPLRRATFDASAEGRRARDADTGTGGNATASFGEESNGSRPTGPPPPPRTAPVTARYDTSSSFRPRNTRLEERRPPIRVQPPVSRRAFEEERELRASTPTGPVERRRGARPERLPTVAEALETPLAFGRYHGYTLGEVEMLEPAYLDWIAQTITRDRELVTKARVIQGERNRRQVDRKNKPAAPRFGAAAG